MMPPEIRAAIEHGEAAGTMGYVPSRDDVYYDGMSAVVPLAGCLAKSLFPSDTEVYNAMWGPSEFTITGKLKDYDLTPRLAAIREPVLLTCGDRRGRRQNGKDFQDRFPNARMAVIPQLPTCTTSNADIFTAVINDFLGIRRKYEANRLVQQILMRKKHRNAAIF